MSVFSLMQINAENSYFGKMLPPSISKQCGTDCRKEGLNFLLVQKRKEKNNFLFQNNFFYEVQILVDKKTQFPPPLYCEKC